MSRFTLDSKVHGDLDNIWDFIGVERGNPRAARRLIGRLYEAFSSLARQPEMGERREDLGPNVRAFVVRPYLVLYRPRPGGVQIAQVVHSARDIQAVARTKEA